MILFILSLSCLRGQESGPQPGLRVSHYDFTLTLPDTGRIIDGRATITILRTNQVNHLLLDFVDLRVDSVLVDGRNSIFQRTPGIIDIPLDSKTSPPSDTAVVTVRYGGSVKDGLIIRSDAAGRWYAFGDNWPTRARRWLPTIDRPDAKATVSWNIIAPNDRKVVANGELVEQRTFLQTTGGGPVSRTLTRWRTFRPIPPYLMVIGVGPLITYDLGLTAPGLSEFPPGVRQTVYAFPESQSYLPGPFKRAGEIVQLFATLVAPFPYEKLAHVQSLTRYGGMENASAIFYADNYFRRRSTNPAVIAHETAHQWFGDAVTPKTFGHVWLSEGFATYFEELWEEKSEGEDAFRKGMNQLRDEIIDARETYASPVLDTLETNFMRLLNSNSYQKGAWVLHMLRSQLGDSVFFSGIRLYYARHRHANATTDDLCESMENAAHTSLRWFFDQWLRRPGIPELTVSWEYDQKNRRVTLQIEQSSRFPAYRVPLKIEIEETAGGKQRAMVEIPAEQMLRVALPLAVESRPTRILFDPSIELLAVIKSN